MGEKLRVNCNYLYKIIFATSLLIGVVYEGGYGQSLSAGDLAFTGINVDSDEGFAVVALDNIPAGTEIHFSNEEWDGSSFDGSGGDLTWIVPSEGVPTGTVVVFGNVDSEPTVNIGSIGTGDSNFGLSSTGDVIYAYTGADQETPDTFLGAIATSDEKYNRADQNLDNTGLTEGKTAILLSYSTDVAQYIGGRDGNTPSGYLKDLNNIENWEEYGGNDDQSSKILPFDTTPFTLVNPPTLTFSTSRESVREDDGVLTVEVKLAESNGQSVNIDVVYLESASTISPSDITGFSMETVSFSGSDASGVAKSVNITLNDDADFEGTETAVFQLQNNTTGSIIEPSVLTVNIKDDESPDIVINEILADPGGADVNRDDSQSSTADEFVEIINNGSSEVDISGWQLTDDEDGAVAHTFPSGTVLSAGKALVVFSGGNPAGNFGGAIVQLASTESIGLTNDGATVSLLDSRGNEIDKVTYGSEADNDQSLTRDPNNSAKFIKHSEAENSGGDLFSPGTKVDGSPFGADHAIAFRGTEGWRMVSSPVQSATFNDLFSDLWMQGVTGSDDPSGGETLYQWDEAGPSFSSVANMSDNMQAGKGYIVYVFEDDQYNTPGIQGGFPKIINVDGSTSNTVSVPVSASDSDGQNGIDGDEGWNMLGNPFGTDLSAGAIIDKLEGINSSVNANLYVWDHEAGGGNGGWVTKDDGDLIAPFQGFFVRFTSSFSSQNVDFSRSSLEANEGTEFHKENTQRIAFDLQLHGDQYFDTYTIEFSNEGALDLDSQDAYKLFSLNNNSINLFSTLNGNKLQKNVLPKELDSNLEIPLSFEGSGRTKFTFRWKNEFNDLPSEWDFILIDKKQDREINLRRSEEYSFQVDPENTNSTQTKQQADRLLNKFITEKEDESRFALAINPNVQQAGNSSQLPEDVKLKPNYPNPFNPSTTIPYEVTEDSEVKLTVWNMIGQKVATLVDGIVEAGSHEETWNATDMPSGIYIARFEVNGSVFTRKMTLIK